MKNSTLVITLGSVAVVLAVALPLLRQGASNGGGGEGERLAARPPLAGDAAGQPSQRAPASIPKVQPSAPTEEIKPSLRRLLLVPPIQRGKRERSAEESEPEYVSLALRSGAPKVTSGGEDYLVLPHVGIVEVGTGDEGDAALAKLEDDGARILERRGGLVFVQLEEAAADGTLPQAVYNPRTKRLAVLTGTYKVKTETGGAGASLAAGFGHMKLVAEFAGIKLSLLQSREGSRLLADLEALRSRPGVVSAELEILEHEAKGI